jgi:hypothetical protein
MEILYVMFKYFIITKINGNCNTEIPRELIQDACFRFCLEVHFLTLQETLERVNNESETPAKETVVPYAMTYATFRLDRLSGTPDRHLTFDRG